MFNISLENRTHRKRFINRDYKTGIGTGWTAWRVLLLLILFAQLLSAAPQLSATIDEGAHITSGYTSLRTGDYRLVEEHPPLVKMWAAIPLLPVTDLPDPRAYPAWEQAAQPSPESLPLLTLTRQWFYVYKPIDRLLVPARAMVALLAIILAAVVSRWATDLWGDEGGILALFLLTFDPNILAHSSVAGTDLGTACFITVALFSLRRFLHRPNKARMILAGITLGLALGTKLPALLLLPVTALLGLYFLVLGRQGKRDRFAGLARLRLGTFRLQLTLLMVIAALSLWGLYRFEIGYVPGISFPIPAASHARPWLRLRWHMDGGHPAFLMGENRSDGWWTYFPIAFVLKTPLPTLILCAVAIIPFCTGVLKGGKRACGVPEDGDAKRSERPRERGRRAENAPPTFTLEESCLLLFPILYALASVLSSLNIGYRHLLPVLPFLYIFAARLASPLFRQSRAGFPACLRHARIYLRASCLVLALWLVLGTLNIAPHYLTYFNEIVGGPEDGWRYLADSNTDWGQAYKELARFQAQEGLEAIKLSAFIFYDPAIYGISYTPLTPMPVDTPPIFPARFSPPPGDYVISVTPLDGIPAVDPEMYDWFRWRKPEANIANAFHTYHVTQAETEIQWVAQCITPTAPLDDAAIAFGFGRDDLRRVEFNCEQAWMIPQAGGQPGAYVLHGAHVKDTLKARLHYAPPPLHNALIEQNLSQARLIYRQREYRSEPAFVLYRRPAGAPVLPTISAWVAAAETPMQALESQPLSETPQAFDGPLTFLGATCPLPLTPSHQGRGNTILSQAERELEVETWWQITGSAEGRPLSLMAHLLSAEGTMLGSADGLGSPPDIWQDGDIIIQRHRFALSQEQLSGLAGDFAYILRTGVYWLDSGERWRVVPGAGVESVPDNADALFIPLTP